MARKPRKATPEALRLYVLARDKNACVYCGKEAFTIDHVVPYDNYGPSVRGNLVTSCKSCNSHKHSSMDEKWLLIGFRHLLSKGEDLKWID